MYYIQTRVEYIYTHNVIKYQFVKMKCKFLFTNNLMSNVPISATLQTCTISDGLCLVRAPFQPNLLYLQTGAAGQTSFFKFVH